MTSPSPAGGLSAAETAAYLRRLGLSAPGPPGLANLNALHVAHQRRVPFENLDIEWGRPISLALPDVYRKVMEEGRGGYCYELNSLFAALLRALGYAVDFLSARVGRPDGTLSAEFDHLALRVSSAGWPDAFLADVGFGDAFLEPLPLQDGLIRREGSKTLRLEERGGQWLYLEDRGEGFRPQYAFALTPYPLDAFAERNVWQQTAPESHFVRSPLCSRATEAGRLSLSGRRLIVTERGVKTERELDDAEVTRVLREHFGVIRPVEMGG